LIAIQCDKDKDGTIDLKEFTSFVRDQPEEYAKIASRLNITLS